MDVLSSNLLDALTSWNIETKLSTIIMDNCTSNDGMLSIIVDKLRLSLLLEGKLVHMRCCAHILNLVVKDGLSMIENSIERIRNSVAYWSAPPSRVEKFEDMVRQMKVTCEKKLCLDCKTRWNSMFLMLQTTICYKEVFPILQIRDKNYSCLPTECDWMNAETIAEKLEIFYIATKLFFGRKFPTANCFFVQICQLRNALVKWIEDDDVFISSMASKMFEKFEKYWSIISIVLAVAVVSDPRYKLKVVSYYFPQIYSEKAQYEIENLKKICYELLHVYQSNSKNPRSSQGSSIQVPNLPRFQQDDLTKLVAFLSESSSTNVTVNSELDHYLDEATLPWTQDFDILNWWKTLGIRYPTLQQIAKDFLAIPVSTVASESAFSTSGRVVSLHRSRLHPNTLEALMCSQSWLWNSNQNDGKECIYINIFN